MKQALFVLLLIALIGSGHAHGQVAGNVGYGQTGGRARAELNERAQRSLAQNDLPPSPTTMFVEASVLMNVKADEYVAVFAITHEGKTLADCSKKMDATVNAFSKELKTLGIAGDDLFVDFIAQNRIYGFEAQGDILQEKLVGFELKKNISIHYKDRDRLEKITLAASQAQVFDLIKVDYIVKDINRVQDQLMDEAARIAKHKIARNEKLLGIKLKPSAQIYATRSATHYPTQMYDSYVASESEEIYGGPDRRKYTVRSARKSRTFYFNPLDGNGFDDVINPVVTEPIVQFTLYLKVKYEIEQSKAK
jgi:uncharacterized protein YggE